jgi:hypothetical protein
MKPYSSEFREKIVKIYSNPKSFVNLLLPNRGFGEGWGGVKNLRLLQELLYEQGDTSIRKVAARFEVSKGFVQKILKQKQTTGHV